MSPFFNAWKLYGKHPKILDDAVVGESARPLFAEGQTMLKQLIAESGIQANGVIGLFPALREGNEDIARFDPNSGDKLMNIHCLRQQNRKADGKSNWCLADFIAPADSGKQDYTDLFAVAAGFSIDPHVQTA